MNHDNSILEAALIGYQLEAARITKAMADIRARIGGVKVAPSQTAPLKRRKLSAAARKRIAAGQRKRWAEFRKKQSEKQA